jgi:uncharacterized protein (DUF169 family)
MLKYAELSENMKNYLLLENSPIAVSFSTTVPENIPQMTGKIRLCQMLDRVRLVGEIFYTTTCNHQCDGGLGSCGMKEMNENIKSGEFLCNMGLFGSPRAARRFINSNPRIQSGTVNVLTFSPLEKATFEPDVVALICNAKQGMIIAEAFAYDTSKRATGMTGPPICSSIVAAPFLTGEVTYSFGDHGARKNMNIKDEEVFVGIPGELLKDVIENLGKLTF